MLNFLTHYVWVLQRRLIQMQIYVMKCVQTEEIDRLNKKVKKFNPSEPNSIRLSRYSWLQIDALLLRSNHIFYQISVCGIIDNISPKILKQSVDNTISAKCKKPSYHHIWLDTRHALFENEAKYQYHLFFPYTWWQ